MSSRYIRIVDEGRIFKEVLNENFRFVGLGGLEELEPGEVFVGAYGYEALGDKEIDIVPIIFKNNKPVLCENVVIGQIVTCR